MFGSPDFAKLVLEGASERERVRERAHPGDKMINGKVLPVGLHVLAQTGLWRDFRIEVRKEERTVTT